MKANHWSGWLLVSVLLSAAMPEAARAAGPYAIVSGRWDNTVVVIDLVKAIDPANDGTANAVINRLRVIPDIDPRNSGIADTPASGQPVNVVIPPEGRFAYVVNHSGRATPAATEAFQHGHEGTVTVLDLRKALDPANNWDHERGGGHDFDRGLRCGRAGGHAGPPVRAGLKRGGGWE